MERCQTCSILQHFQSLGNWPWLCFICNFEFPSSVQSVLYLCHSLYSRLSVWAVAYLCGVRRRMCTCVCAHAISCSVPSCLSCGLSACGVCVRVWLADWVCVCLPEWNVSLISLLLLEGRRGGLYSVISASLWPPLSTWRTWEHTRRRYIEAFKHLILQLFHYNRKTFCFVCAFLLRTALWNCGWRVTNGSVKSITKRAFDWLIDCWGLACGGVDRNNEHLRARSGYSKHNFSCKRPSVQNTCQELAMRGIIALRVVRYC